MALVRSFDQAAIALLALSITTVARGHDCGPPIIFVTQGQSVTWEIHADLTEILSEYTVLIEPNPAIATATWPLYPFNPFFDHHGTFTITGVSPGTTSLSVHWFYAKTGFQNVCGVTIVVDPLPKCIGDLDGDGDTDQQDIVALLIAYGTPDGDLDGDGDTDAVDLQTLLEHFSCPGPPQDPPDCNRDGQADAMQIVTDTASDFNQDAVPDICQAIVNITQTNWVNPFGIVTAPNTDIGQFTITTLTPSPGQVAFLNVSLDDRWVIENAPIFQLTREAPQGTFTFFFDLTTPPGVPSPPLVYIASLSDIPAPARPTSRNTVVKPVTPHLSTPGTVQVPGVPLGTTFTPGGGENYFGGLSTTSYTIKQRLSVPSVAEPPNFCVPGGVARSLAWMNDFYSLGLPSSMTAQVIMEQLAIPMQTHAAGPPAEIGTLDPNKDAALSSFIADHGLGEELEVETDASWAGGNPTPDDIAKGLGEGCDAMFSVGWYEGATRKGGHFMTAVGVAIPNDGGPKQIAFKDDGFGGDRQGDGQPDVGASVVQFRLIAGEPGRYEMVGAGAATNKLERVVSICPRETVRARAVEKRAQAAQAAMGSGVAGIDAGFIVTEASKGAEAADFLNERVVNHFDDEPAILAAAARLSTSMSQLRALAIDYQDEPSPGLVSQMLALLNGPIESNLATLIDRFDCNSDGIDDGYQISAGLLPDSDGDGILDVCELDPEDLNGDGHVNGMDLAILLGHWTGAAVYSPCPPFRPEDFNHDCRVSGIDLAILLAAWAP